MKESELEVSKIEESESELLCTDSTALPTGVSTWKLEEKIYKQIVNVMAVISLHM
jgi:hypothetical protein